MLPMLTEAQFLTSIASPRSPRGNELLTET